MKNIKPSGMALPDESQCPHCGYFDITHPDVQRILKARDPTGRLFSIAQCKCPALERQHKSRMAIMAQQANLPRSNPVRTLMSFQSRDGTVNGLTAAQALMKGQAPPILCLQGEYGTGKSHLLEGLVRQSLAEEHSARYELASELLDRLRHTYDDDSAQDMYELMQWYHRLSLLVIDDLGLQRTTDFGIEKLTEIFDHRLRYQKRLAIATNCSESEFAAKMGGRLASRVFQRNPLLQEVTLVHMTATDYRR